MDRRPLGARVLAIRGWAARWVCGFFAISLVLLSIPSPLGSMRVVPTERTSVRVGNGIVSASLYPNRFRKSEVDVDGEVTGIEVRELFWIPRWTWDVRDWNNIWRGWILMPHYYKTPMGGKNEFVYALIIPLWIPGAALGAMSATAWNRRMKRSRMGLCPKCRYDLVGLPADAPCPECGRTRAG